MLRNYSIDNAIHNLAQKCDPVLFEETFGAPISQIKSLIEGKTVTIQKILQILPPETQDPTYFIYVKFLFYFFILFFYFLFCF